MRVTLKKSPIRDKKYRVTFPNGDHVDFGGKGYTDYTIHKDPMRMRLYVLRHGGGDTRKLKTQSGYTNECWAYHGANSRIGESRV
jgi:hypothetical protein